jgi:hypothetical protein
MGRAESGEGGRGMGEPVRLMLFNILRVEHLFGGFGSEGSSSSSMELHLQPIGMVRERFLNGVGDVGGEVLVGKMTDGAEGEGEIGGVGREGNFVSFMFLGDSRRGVLDVL